MGCESDLNHLLNSLQSSEIEVGTTVEVCTSFFRLGDRFSSFKEIQETIKNVENKNGTKYWIVDGKKITTLKTKYDNIVNQALVYRYLKYACIQGGRKHGVRRKIGVPIRLNTSTLRNGCQAHVKFSISRDRQYLEVKGWSDVHNHEISKIKVRTKNNPALANKSVNFSPWKSGNPLPTELLQGTKCLVAFPVQSADGQNPGGTVIPPASPPKKIPSQQRILNEDRFTGPDDRPKVNAEEDVVENREIEEKMLLIRSRADKAVEDLVREKKRSNDLKEQLLEESRKRNQYLQALLKVKCLKYNKAFEELIQD